MKVLGESYSPDDDEDMAFATVSSVWIPRGRSRTEVMVARAGNWVLLGGVDADIVKTATIVGAGKSNFGGDDGDGEIHTFSPLKFPQVSFHIKFITIRCSLRTSLLMNGSLLYLF